SGLHGTEGASMDEMDRPAETPAAASSDAGPAEAGHGEAANSIDAETPDSLNRSTSSTRRAPRRAPRRRKKAPAEEPPEPPVAPEAYPAEVEEVAAVPETAEAGHFTGAAPVAHAPEPDEATLDAAELEVVEAGEPIPLLLRESIPLETAALSNDVLVPE